MQKKVLWVIALIVLTNIVTAFVVDHVSYRTGLTEGVKSATMNKVVMSPSNELAVVRFDSPTAKFVVFTSVEEGRYKEYACGEVHEWQSDTNPLYDLKGEIVATLQYAPRSR